MKQHTAVGEKPNVPKRLDSHELNSHKHGKTCTHSSPHPPPCPSHHSVTQHIQGLLFVAVDELLNEWPFIMDAPLCNKAHTGEED